MGKYRQPKLREIDDFIVLDEWKIGVQELRPGDRVRMLIGTTEDLPYAATVLKIIRGKGGGVVGLIPSDAMAYPGLEPPYAVEIARIVKSWRLPPGTRPKS